MEKRLSFLGHDAMVRQVMEEYAEAIEDARTKLAEGSHEPCKKLFALTNPQNYMNHGSYGAVFAPTRRFHELLLAKFNECPNAYIEEPYQAAIAKTIEKLSAMVQCKEEEMFLVPNATYGVGSVVRSFPFVKGDVLLTMSSNYLACLHAMSRATEETQARLVVAKGLPKDREGFLEGLREHLERERPRLVVLDHITSSSGLVLPIKEAAALCK